MRSLMILVLLAGCGGAGDAKPATEKPVAEAPVTAKPAEADVGPDGPADLKVPDLSSLPADEASIAVGKGVFEQKGCGACHAFGKKLVGPDLAGLGERRSNVWIGKMIQHPEEMTKKDPVAKGLYRSLMVQMTNQGVTDEDLPKLIAYIESEQPK